MKMGWIPEMVGVTFSDSTPIPKFLNLDPGLKIFQIENPTSVQTLATTDATKIQQCFYLINDIDKDHTDFCYCQK